MYPSASVCCSANWVAGFCALRSVPGGGLLHQDLGVGVLRRRERIGRLVLVDEEPVQLVGERRAVAQHHQQAHVLVSRTFVGLPALRLPGSGAQPRCALFSIGWRLLPSKIAVRSALRYREPSPA